MTVLKQDATEAPLPLVSSDLAVKTAWLYYVEGFTQEQIAEKLGVTRIKVMRTLAACAADGVVTTAINASTASQIRLERELEKRWGLAAAVVVPTPSNEASLEKSIGHAVAATVTALPAASERRGRSGPRSGSGPAIPAEPGPAPVARSVRAFATGAAAGPGPRSDPP